MLVSPPMYLWYFAFQCCYCHLTLSHGLWWNGLAITFLGMCGRLGPDICFRAYKMLYLVISSKCSELGPTTRPGGQMSRTRGGSVPYLTRSLEPVWHSPGLKAASLLEPGQSRFIQQRWPLVLTQILTTLSPVKFWGECRVQDYGLKNTN